MRCKNCKAHLEKNVTVCPVCNTECKKKKLALPLWAIICITVLAVAVAVLGVLLALNLINGWEAPFRSYTASEAELIEHKDRVIAKVGEHELTNAELQIYYWVYVYSFMEDNSYYLSFMGLDHTKDFATQECYLEKGISWQEYFIDQALAGWYQYTILNIAAEEADYKLPDTEQKYLDELGKTFDEQAKKYGFADANEMINREMGAGATFDAYAQYMKESFVATGYYDVFSDGLEIAEEKIVQYYEDNKAVFEENKIAKGDFAWVSVRHILIAPVLKDDDGNAIDSKTAWANALAKAEAVLALYKKNAGGEIDEEAFAALVEDNTADGGSKTNGGLYKEFYKGEMVQPFEDWSFDSTRKYGDTGIVETDFGYHIMFFVEGQEQWHYYAEYQLKSEICVQMQTEVKNRYPIEADYNKILIGHVELG